MNIVTDISPVEAIDRQLQQSHPKAVLEYAYDNYALPLISFSGAEDVVLIDMAASIVDDPSRIRVFCLDTGRLHSETYRFIERVREHYGIDIELQFPDHDRIENLVREKGLFSFYRDGHSECCGVRKIQPLRKVLKTTDCWITGVRRDQSPDTRNNVPVIANDNANAAGDSELVKFNPLAGWTSVQVWEYIRMFDVPYNELHDKGFISIGCEPCTRPVGPNQHEREGRWWWESSHLKECGLHVAKKET